MRRTLGLSDSTINVLGPSIFRKRPWSVAAACDAVQKSRRSTAASNVVSARCSCPASRRARLSRSLSMS